jgi:hypothetical protein
MNGRQEAARFVLSEWRTGIVKKRGLKRYIFSRNWFNRLVKSIDIIIKLNYNACQILENTFHGFMGAGQTTPCAQSVRVKRERMQDGIRDHQGDDRVH